MKRVVSAVLSSVLWLSGAAFATEYEEGIHYEPIVPKPPVAKVGEKVEVVEFFMYGCPHCFNFEPTVNAWLKRKADDVEFVRVPAMFGRHFNMHAKAYYALEAIGALESVHESFFVEIHEKRNALKSRESVDDFLRGQGVDMTRFSNAMDSFAVAAKANQAASLLRRYGIKGVPALVIDGRYKSGRGLTFKDMVNMADQVVGDVREERRTATQ